MALRTAGPPSRFAAAYYLSRVEARGRIPDPERSAMPWEVSGFQKMSPSHKLLERAVIIMGIRIYKTPTRYRQELSLQESSAVAMTLDPSSRDSLLGLSN